MSSQIEKAAIFKRLHEKDSCFIIPNPWDIGSAKILTNFGFEALATTSAGLAFSLGRRDGDGSLTCGEVLANARQIVEATDLPVSADLENGYSNQPEEISKTVTRAAQTGIVGGSIEDTTTNSSEPIREFGLAVECVRAAVEAKNSLSFSFMLTARAENYLYGRPDLADTICRLQAFQEAGADVLFAPGITSKEDIAAVVSSVDLPVNVVMGLQGVTLSLAELTAIGVRRVSLGSSLSRAAFGGFLNAISEIKQHGTFEFAERATPFGEMNAFFTT